MRKLILMCAVILVIGVMIAPAIAQDDMMGLPDWYEHTACDVDMSGETITLWHIGDLSGPYAPITQPFLAGFADAATWFNEHGGICGAEIALPDPTTIDTGGDQEQTSVIYERVKEDDPDFIILYASADAELLRDRVVQDETAVIISAGSIEGLYGGEDDNYAAPGWIYATNPLYVDQLGTFCEYAAENIENPVIGYISWPNAFGRAAFTDETQAYCEGLGVDVLDTPEYFAPGSDISGQVQNLIDAGATILYTNSLATGPAEIAATVTNLGLRDQVTLAGVNWVMDTSVGFLGQASIGPDGLPSVNGLLGSMPFVWWTETDNPAIQLITEVADANERAPLTRNIAYLLGWQTVDLARELYAVSSNRIGSADVDGPDINQSLSELVYSPMGMVELDFTDGNRDASANRISVLRYLGQNGGPAELPDNPPVVVEGANGPILIPIVVPLMDFEETPDLRPGMMMDE